MLFISSSSLPATIVAMKAMDHYLMCQYLWKCYGRGLSAECRRAFLFGSFEPDRNPITYLLLPCHRASATLPLVRDRLGDLASASIWMPSDWFHLGQALHYLCDAFTWPHNEGFEGDLGDHLDWEGRIHGAILSSGFASLASCRLANTSRLVADLEDMHDDYLEGAHSPEDDLHHIVPILFMAFSSLMECHSRQMALTLEAVL